MRLKPETIDAILSILKKHLPTSYYQLYLYGSRVYDHLKGGDIDLLLLLENAIDKPIAEGLKYKILAELKSRVGDQKIDLCIYARDRLGQEPFLDEIIISAQLLR